MNDISTAPKDRVIKIMNPKHGATMSAKFNSKRNQWEGKLPGALCWHNIYWDPEDEIQPTHWEEVNE